MLKEYEDKTGTHAGQAGQADMLRDYEDKTAI